MVKESEMEVRERTMRLRFKDGVLEQLIRYSLQTTGGVVGREAWEPVECVYGEPLSAAKSPFEE